ncbi:hypothetical protein JCM10212_005507 [Sporobolomyces blumeae]
MGMSRVPVRDVWPANEQHLRPIVTTLYLACVAILSALLAKRWLGWTTIKRLPVAKLLVLAVLADSFLFIFASAVIVLGVGTSFSPIACKLGIWWCIILYASSKVLIYSFLAEKLLAVYSVRPDRRIPRWRCLPYVTAMVGLAAWVAVAGAMIAGRIAFIRQHDDACVIGLRLYATVPMLVCDAVVNIYLTAAFVVPIARSKWDKAQRLAMKSCVAAIAALVTSFANIAVLTIEHGHQLSWVCLGSCGLDVTVNAIILFIVTASPSSSHDSDPSGRYPPAGPTRLAGGPGFSTLSYGGGRTADLTTSAVHCSTSTGGPLGKSSLPSHSGEKCWGSSGAGERRSDEEMAELGVRASSFAKVKQPSTEIGGLGLRDVSVPAPVHTLPPFKSTDSAMTVDSKKSSLGGDRDEEECVEGGSPIVEGSGGRVGRSHSTSSDGSRHHRQCAGSPPPFTSGLSGARVEFLPPSPRLAPSKATSKKSKKPSKDRGASSAIHGSGTGTGGILVSEEIVMVREEGVIEPEEEWKDSAVSISASNRNRSYGNVPAGVESAYGDKGHAAIVPSALLFREPTVIESAVGAASSKTTSRRGSEAEKAGSGSLEGLSAKLGRLAAKKSSGK